MRYEILYGSDIPFLEKQVNSYLIGGWSLVGGVATDAAGNLYQAVVRVDI